jgi:hypothetical protein
MTAQQGRRQLMIRLSEWASAMRRSPETKEKSRNGAAIAALFGGLAAVALIIDFCITCVIR